MAGSEVALEMRVASAERGRLLGDTIVAKLAEARRALAQARGETHPANWRHFFDSPRRHSGRCRQTSARVRPPMGVTSGQNWRGRPTGAMTSESVGGAGDQREWCESAREEERCRPASSWRAPSEQEAMRRSFDSRRRQEEKPADSCKRRRQEFPARSRRAPERHTEAATSSSTSIRAAREMGRQSGAPLRPGGESDLEPATGAALGRQTSWSVEASELTGASQIAAARSKSASSSQTAGATLTSGRPKKLFLATMPFEEAARRRRQRRQAAAPLAAQLALRANLCLLAGLLLVGLLKPLAAHEQAEEARQREPGHSSVLHARQHEPNSDLLAPPFAPTRRPGALPSASSFREPAGGLGPAPFSEESRPLAVGRQPHGIHFKSADAREAKFERANELDAFLDEMDHRELQTVAAGRPIEDLFQARPQPQPQLRPQPQPQSSPGEDPRAGSGPSETRQLMGSHSEPQIYSECALILQRTYVKNIDHPKHQLVPFGKTEQACISYKHIDKAVEQAKHKLKFREFARMRAKPVGGGGGGGPIAAPLETIQTSLEPPEELVAAIGEINMAATQIIADQFDLSNDELLNGLPLIDMSKTKFWDLCPLFVRQTELKCELARFRTFTGHCNNLKHPTWGAARTPYARYLPPVHPDGVWVPRKSIVSEITFDVGIGHRETHANIGPAVPLARLRNEHHGQHNFPPTRHLEELSAAAAAASVHSPVAAPAPPHLSSPIEALARQADAELARLAQTDPLALVRPTDQQFNGQLGQLGQLGYPGHPNDPNLLNQLNHLNQLKHLNHLNHFQHQRAAVAAAASDHQRLELPHVHQGAHKTRSIAQELPSARLVTSLVHRDMDAPNHDFTVLFMSWGQLLDHDMTRAAQPPTSIKCCPQADGRPPDKHKLCLPIQVAPDDPFYAKFNVQCLEFRRTLAGVRPNCVLGPRVHQNANTAPIDANFVYGSSQATADSLRLFRGGRLRDRDWFHREALKPLLPAQEVEPDLACLGRPRDLFCFLAGDVRVNEQTHLTVLHTLYMREHNKLADKLAELNPHWDDERTFQEARHIVAAQVQHVLINEYIPLLIGRKMSELYNLTTGQTQPAPLAANTNDHDHHHSAPHSFWHGYDPSVTTSVANSFAAAAFRQGHTFVQSTIDRFNKFHEFVSSEKLRHLFMQPFLLYQPGVLDELVGGLINKQSQSYDPFVSEEISGHLFQPPEQEFGHDLAAINLQRGRDQGLPGYNLFREWCGLPRAETFEQLEPYLTNHTAYQYSRIYKHVDDIDLWSGGISERKLPGAAIGPTFACIIARQFSNTRRGDRFWYENPGLPSSFTPDQLAEIRKVTLARLLCANADDLPTIQRWAFRMAHPILNPRLDCHALPQIDLQFWQEE